MKSNKLVFIILILGVSVILPNTKNSRAEGCAIDTTLTNFVAQETDYPTLGKCPRVRVITETALKAIFINASAHSELPTAAFLPATSEILLSPDIDTKSIIGRSYIVHEIVHASQFANNVSASTSCPGLLESEAYRVQASYLKKHGSADEAFTFVLISMLQRACGQAYIP
jgi:hypothetical protein